MDAEQWVGRILEGKKKYCTSLHSLLRNKESREIKEGRKTLNGYAFKIRFTVSTLMKLWGRGD